MKVQIPDALYGTTDALIVDNEGQPLGHLLFLTAKNGEAEPALIALDFRGATKLAEILVPFLREHPDLKHGLEG